MTRLVLVHGSVTNADLSWGRQRVLVDRFELVLPNRPGFPPGPRVERVDFERDAEWLGTVVRPGDHLVGHSYGGVGALLAAPALELGSLTVIEPPAFGVARGDTDVEAWLDGAFALPRHSVRAYAEAFFTERFPTEAAIPLEPLRYRVLVVTGDHEPAFEAVGDVLERELRAERLVLRGAGHAVQNARGFNDRLLEFLRRAP